MMKLQREFCPYRSFGQTMEDDTNQTNRKLSARLGMQKNSMVK